MAKQQKIVRSRIRSRSGNNQVKIDPEAKLKGTQKGSNKYGKWTARVYEK